jgi:hypothetical protein
MMAAPEEHEPRARARAGPREVGMTEIAIVITGEPLPGVFAWEVAEFGLAGKSRQPLLDGCRALSRAGSSPSDFAVLVWAGRPGWALRAKIGVTARLTTAEERRDGGPRLAPRRKWDGVAGVPIPHRNRRK